MAKKKIKVALIFGGTSQEREVSLRSGMTIAKYLDTKKFEVVPIELAKNGKLLISSPTINNIASQITAKRAKSTRELVPVAKADKAGIDVAFLALHGPGGEDGTIQGMLDLMKIPYTCSGVLASSLAMDKARTKRLLTSANILVLPDFVITKDDYKKNKYKILKKIRGRVVVKPNRIGSSLGVTIASGRNNISKAITTALIHDDEILVEPFLSGREITVPVLGNHFAEALPTIEIIPWKKSTFYDYAAKYEQGGSKHVIPAQLTKLQEQGVQLLALKAHRELGCRGVTRSDFILAKNGKFYFLEINTIPGMTPTSLAPQSAQAAGIDFPELLERLIKLALEKN
ncbi:MAG: D-alanine--D-alanine ligase [Candidatus Doudnabacteria bacterium CG10_big_fil_rev_8_21_14_0_10_41_10]|uniref:D-alanine--D-alanine ligase n=1 Tax=Candidatus Doudnabacteria bacterium CG10_big_fil_rev_8_21_14_0_10_41_10 TaxID=1974551 RepID=A0A2H0VFT4_9BACT|nr:MAG: D-alanine--D-alanine ligase [Candidatus Doudnabacteria bacterium CG10_big_fil_rev_8_21_14_0_10_41_10]